MPISGQVADEACARVQITRGAVGKAVPGVELHVDYEVSAQTPGVIETSILVTSQVSLISLSAQSQGS